MLAPLIKQPRESPWAKPKWGVRYLSCSACGGGKSWQSPSSMHVEAGGVPLLRVAAAGRDRWVERRWGFYTAAGATIEALLIRGVLLHFSMTAQQHTGHANVKTSSECDTCPRRCHGCRSSRHTRVPCYRPSIFNYEFHNAISFRTESMDAALWPVHEWHAVGLGVGGPAG